MKLTPLDIRHKEFRRAMRGYSDEDVDLFLDEVADEFERLFQENIEARERLEQLEDKLRHHESLKETLQKTLVSAQQQADGTLINARKEAELILKDAEIKGRDLVNESYGEKQRVQQALIQLKQVEEDFRFKFRSLLEAHLNLLSEDEVSAERKRFRGLVAGMEADLREERDSDAPSRPVAPPQPTPTAAPALRLPAPPTASEPPSPAPAEVETAPAVPAAGPAPDVFVEAEGFLEGAPAVEAEEAPAPSAATRPPGGVPDTQAASTAASASEASSGSTEPEHRRRVDPSSLLEFDDDPDTPASAYDDLEFDRDRREDRGQRKDSSVRRFLFGRKEAQADREGDFFDEPEDREFHW